MKKKELIYNNNIYNIYSITKKKFIFNFKINFSKNLIIVGCISQIFYILNMKLLSLINDLIILKKNKFYSQIKFKRFSKFIFLKKNKFLMNFYNLLNDKFSKLYLIRNKLKNLISINENFLLLFYLFTYYYYYYINKILFFFNHKINIFNKKSKQFKYFIFNKVFKLFRFFIKNKIFFVRKMKIHKLTSNNKLLLSLSYFKKSKNNFFSKINYLKKNSKIFKVINKIKIILSFLKKNKLLKKKKKILIKKKIFLIKNLKKKKKLIIKKLKKINLLKNFFFKKNFNKLKLKKNTLIKKTNKLKIKIKFFNLLKKNENLLSKNKNLLKKIKIFKLNNKFIKNKFIFNKFINNKFINNKFINNKFIIYKKLKINNYLYKYQQLFLKKYINKISLLIIRQNKFRKDKFSAILKKKRKFRYLKILNKNQNCRIYLKKSINNIFVTLLLLPIGFVLASYSGGLLKTLIKRKDRSSLFSIRQLARLASLKLYQSNIKIVIFYPRLDCLQMRKTIKIMFKFFYILSKIPFTKICLYRPVIRNGIRKNKIRYK